MDVAKYKEGLTSLLSQLEKNGCDAGLLAALRVDAVKETEPRKLILMYQTLLEVVDKEYGGDGNAEFLIQTPEGVKLKARNLEEGRKIARDYGNIYKANQGRDPSDT